MIVKHLQIIFNRGFDNASMILAITWYVGKNKLKLHYNYSKTKLKMFASKRINSYNPHEVIILSCSKYHHQQ